MGIRTFFDKTILALYEGDAEEDEKLDLIVASFKKNLKVLACPSRAHPLGMFALLSPPRCLAAAPPPPPPPAQ